MFNEITRAADGCMRAEEAGLSPPISASSGLIIDEAPGIVASVARIDAWMEVAKPGDRFVYASRGGLPARSAGAARMRELAKRGLVELTQLRSTLDPKIFNYQARRTSKLSALSRPDRPRLVAATAPVLDDEAATVDALLPVLARFAAKGRPCPTDKQLAERAGIPAAAVQAALAAMTAAHLIRIVPAPGPTNRRILILSTGAITGLAA